ncbi:hypothetical protein IAD21_04604 [Abditibacteriota bacterium]|nr:hypothetical protein IAD21_04604 [Abditibacteriota bacterium]
MMAQKILILTTVKDAHRFLDSYFLGIHQLSYPHELISLGLLEGDSTDGTFEALEARLPQLQKEFAAVGLWKKDFAFQIPEGTPRWASHIQLQRRSILAKSRNHLLFRALDEEDWVLWLDVDVIKYPADIIERLLATGKEIIHPNCVREYGGKSFDLNAWRDQGKLHLHDLKGEGDLVPLHAVGGTMLLIKADVHREGLIFPTFLYGKRNPLIRPSNKMVGITSIKRRSRQEHYGEVETEGLGMMAYDMGYECWGMPNLEIKHTEE